MSSNKRNRNKSCENCSKNFLGWRNQPEQRFCCKECFGEFVTKSTIDLWIKTGKVKGEKPRDSIKNYILNE